MILTRQESVGAVAYLIGDLREGVEQSLLRFGHRWRAVHQEDFSKEIAQAVRKTAQQLSRT